MDVNLTFNAEKHEYRLDGVVIPSVTQIISGIGINDYSTVKADARVRAQERGSIVHEIIELYEKGVLLESSVDNELRGYFESYLRAKDAGLLPERPFAIEKMSCSVKYRYAGTIDQIFGIEWINDLKTGKPCPEHELQLTAYWLMENEGFKSRPKRLTGTYLHKDGSIADVIDYEYNPLTWLAMVTDYRWREKHNKLKKAV